MAENSSIWRFSGCNCDVCRNVHKLEESHLVTQHTCDSIECDGERNWFNFPSQSGKTISNKLWEEVKRVSSIRAKAVDNFIACYLDRTGANIEDLVLIEQESDDHLTHTWWVEPKEKK